MKLETLKLFYDGTTDEWREVGSIFIVSAARGRELLSHELGLVREIEESKPKTASPKSKKGAK